MTVSVPLWLHYPWLHVPVTCRDIKGDPILLVFVVSATCHANKDLAGRSWQDHKMAITGGFLRKSWPAGDCLTPPSIQPPVVMCKPKQTAALKIKNPSGENKEMWLMQTHSHGSACCVLFLHKLIVETCCCKKSKRDLRKVLLLQCCLHGRFSQKWVSVTRYVLGTPAVIFCYQNNSTVHEIIFVRSLLFYCVIASMCRLIHKFLVSKGFNTEMSKFASICSVNTGQCKHIEKEENTVVPAIYQR